MSSHLLQQFAAAIGLGVFALGAEAALNVTQFSSRVGDEGGGSASIYYTRQAAASGDALQILTLDASQGGNYVASAMTLKPEGGVPGTYVRFRVRAPLVNRIRLRVTDTNGQTLQFNVDRHLAVVDDQGWATVVVPVSSSSTFWPTQGNNGVLSGNITGLQVVLERGGNGDGRRATAYIRGIEILGQAPQASHEVFPLRYVELDTAVLKAGTEHGAVTGDLQFIPIPAGTGDEVQELQFAFHQAPAYVSAAMEVEPTAATHLRFRLRAPAFSRIRLQVKDETDQTHQFDLDRSAEVFDSAGWAAHTVRLDKPFHSYGGAATGKVQGKIKTVRVLVMPGGTHAPAAGEVYFKEVDLLNHAPSPVGLLHARVTPSTAGPVVTIGASGARETDATSGLAGLTQLLTYDFSPARTWDAPSTVFVGTSFLLSQAQSANRVHFLAKVPQGVSIRMRLKDESNQVVYETNVVKPLGTVDDGGWVKYAVKLDGDAVGRMLTGKVTEVQLGVRRNTNIAVNHAAVQPRGEARFGQLWVGQETDEFDLGAAVPSLATVKPRNTPVLPPVFGVAARHSPTSASLAKSMGFTHMRMDLTWESTQTSLNTLDFSAKDQAVTAMVDNGLSPILILAYNSRFYSGYGAALTPPNPANLVPPTDPWHYGVSTDSNREAFVAFARAAALRYQHHLNAGKSITFEVWNEPNARAFWARGGQPPMDITYAPNPADYAKLLTDTRAAIKSVDARYKVVSAGLARIDFPFLQSIRPALLGSDAVGIHPYTAVLDLAPESHPALTPDSLLLAPESQADETLAARMLLKGGAVTAPLWTTEVGYPAARISEGCEGVAPTRTPTMSGKLLQARRVLREILTSVAMNNAAHVVYQLRDVYPGFSYDCGKFEHNFGILDKDAQPKPLFHALGALRKAVTGRNYQGLLTGNASGVQAMKLAAAGDDVVYIVWANQHGQQAEVTMLPNCQTSWQGGPATGAASCVMDMQQQPVTCRDVNANGRYACPVSEAAGPIFIRTRAQ